MSNNITIFSFPTIVPDLDLNFARTILILWNAGFILFMGFLISRVWWWVILRKNVPVKLDDKGASKLYRSKMNKILGWPGIMVTKLKLKSFYVVGVPSFGTILVLVFWIGVTVFASLWNVLPSFGIDGIAYRLP